jgi:hypothetical protein
VADRVVFLRPDAQRIARAVRAFENGDRDESPLTFRRVLEGGKQRVFRICTFTGAWDIDTTKTLTFKNQTTTPNTVSAVNLFWPVPNSGGRDCAIGKDGTAWYLIVPRLFSADAATAATVVGNAVEFKTLPVAALATSSTATFTLDIISQPVIVDASLGANALEFSRKDVGVLFDRTATTVQISIVTCATSTAS